MAAKTGSTYISKSMTDIIKIPTANLSFRPCTASLNRVSLGDSDNDRQPEIAAETENAEPYISGIMTDIVEILTANLAFSTMASSMKVSPSDCVRQRSITGNDVLYNVWAPILQFTAVCKHNLGLPYKMAVQGHWKSSVLGSVKSQWETVYYRVII